MASCANCKTSNLWEIYIFEQDLRDFDLWLLKTGLQLSLGIVVAGGGNTFQLIWASFSKQKWPLCKAYPYIFFPKKADLRLACNLFWCIDAISLKILENSCEIMSIFLKKSLIFWWFDTNNFKKSKFFKELFQNCFICFAIQLWLFYLWKGYNSHKFRRQYLLLNVQFLIHNCFVKYATEKKDVSK